MMFGNTRNFVILFSVKQLIFCPTRISCSSSTIIDHILTSHPDRVSQKGVIDIAISDHQFIFSTRKTLKTKTGSHKQISFRSLKYYSVVAYEEALKKVKLPNYENFINIHEAYSIFIQKVTYVNSKEWFESVVSEGINNRDKLFKRFKKSRLPLDQENHKKARYEVKKLLLKKIETTLKQNLPKTLAN